MYCISYKCMYHATLQPAIYIYTNRHTVLYPFLDDSWSFLQMYDFTILYPKPKHMTQGQCSTVFNMHCTVIKNRIKKWWWWHEILELCTYVHLYGKSSDCDEIARVQSHIVGCMCRSCIHTLSHWRVYVSLFIFRQHLRALSSYSQIATVSYVGEWWLTQKEVKRFVTHVDKRKSWHRQDLNLRQRRPEPKSGALDHSATMSYQSHNQRHTYIQP